MAVPARRPTLEVMATTFEISEALYERLAEVAARRGITPDELAIEVLSRQLSTGENDGAEALAAFIGSVDTGDPDWASTDTAVLRKRANAQRSA